jgi:hypothetical protein
MKSNLSNIHRITSVGLFDQPHATRNKKRQSGKIQIKKELKWAESIKIAKK